MDWINMAWDRPVPSDTDCSAHARGRHAPCLVALFLTEFLFWVPWYTATPLVRYLGRRYAIQWRGWGALLVHILACMSITLVSAAWSSGLDEVLNPLVKPQNPEPFIPLWLDTVYSGLLLSLFLYAAILSFSYLVESRENLADERVRSAHLSGQLAKAELESLRRQVEPHSLFNSLNAISGLVREGRNAAAVTAIATLGEFLRKIIEHPDHQEVSLGEEVELLETYLNLHKLRFDDRLEISLQVPPDLYACKVPTLILQPLVENAVKHGIEKRAHGGSISVAASRADGWLTIRVYNDGPHLSEQQGRLGSGVGIANLGARLRNLYGDRFELSLRDRESGVEALLSVPLRVG
jgi:two-component system, LytTR family, sensor kinase